MTPRQRILSVIANAMADGEPAPLYKEIAYRANMSMQAACWHITKMRKCGSLVTQGSRIVEMRLSAADAAMVLA